MMAFFADYRDKVFIRARARPRSGIGHDTHPDLRTCNLSDPSRVIRGHRSVAGPKHSVDRGLPLLPRWKVKHQQILLRGRPAYGVITLLCELEMVGCSRHPKHHAVEAFVILEGSYLGQAHTISIDPHNIAQMVCRGQLAA